MTDQHRRVPLFGIQTPPLLSSARLAKLAVVYIRCARSDNPDAVAAQVAQAQLPRALGWSPERIVIIDTDIGRDVNAERFGWHRLLHLMRGDKVGAVFVSDFARLTRSFSEFLIFCNLARAFDVLLVVGSEAVDLNNFPGADDEN